MNVFELIADAMHEPELAVSRKAKVDAAISSGQHVIFDDEQDGHTLRSSVYPIKSPKGGITRLLVIVHDITEQIMAEKQARHNDLVFKALLTLFLVLSLSWMMRAFCLPVIISA